MRIFNMKEKRFLKTTLLATAVLTVCAAGLAILRVRAQISSVQPFEAIMVEEMAPRADQPPIPVTRFQTIAVRSDGSKSNVSKWEVRLPSKVIYSREVIDASAKKHAFVEDTTETIVNATYADVQVLKPGVLCDGKSAEQIQGFDTLYSEHPLPSEDSASSLTHKQWLAPKLGCYPIKQEFVGTIHGQPIDTIQTLASIKLGEPDPWYFSVPAQYTNRTTAEWISLMKPLMKQ
jgi:hypothetical protein